MLRITQAVILVSLAYMGEAMAHATTRIDTHDIPARVQKRQVNSQQWVEKNSLVRLNQGEQQGVKKPKALLTSTSSSVGQASVKKNNVRATSAQVKQSQPITTDVLKSTATAGGKAVTEDGHNNTTTFSMKTHEHSIQLPASMEKAQFSYSYAKSPGAQSNNNASNQVELSVYSTASTEAPVVSKISIKQGFTIKQGDWVRVETVDGVKGWAKISDVEQNINNAWNAAYQVILSGQSSNYTVDKISAEEQQQRYEALQKKYSMRAQRLSRLWDEAFTTHSQEESTEIYELKKQVATLNKKVKLLQENQGKTQKNKL